MKGDDFYHVSEHIHAVRRGVFGENEAAGAAHAGDLLHTVRHEGYEPFWNKLVSPALPRAIHCSRFNISNCSMN